MKVLTLLCGAGVLALCAGLGCNGTVKQGESSEAGAVRQSFATLARAMSEGDLPRAWGLLSTSHQMDKPYEGHYEVFVKAYNEAHDFLVGRFQSAQLTNVAVNEQEAQARVIFGNGDQAFIFFIKEDNIWKMKRLSDRFVPGVR